MTCQILPALHKNAQWKWYRFIISNDSRNGQAELFISQALGSECYKGNYGRSQPVINFDFDVCVQMSITERPRSG